MSLIDTMTDAWRWWSVPGAFLGIVALMPYITALAVSVYRSEEAGTAIIPALPRLVALLSAVAMMAAVFIAGAIIPLADDNRLADFDRKDELFKGLLGISWLFWALACWGIAIAFAPRWRPMTLAAFILGCAALVATREMVGAGL